MLLEEYPVASVELEAVGSSDVAESVTVERNTEVSDDLEESIELLESIFVVVVEKKE